MIRRPSANLLADLAYGAVLAVSLLRVGGLLASAYATPALEDIMLVLEDERKPEVAAMLLRDYAPHAPRRMRQDVVRAAEMAEQRDVSGSIRLLAYITWTARRHATQELMFWIWALVLVTAARAAWAIVAGFVSARRARRERTEAQAAGARRAVSATRTDVMAAEQALDALRAQVGPQSAALGELELLVERLNRQLRDGSGAGPRP